MESMIGAMMTSILARVRARWLAWRFHRCCRRLLTDDQRSEAYRLLALAGHAGTPEELRV